MSRMVVPGTEVCADAGKVGVMTHAGRWQWLSPDQARSMGRRLLAAATECERRADPSWIPEDPRWPS